MSDFNPNRMDSDGGSGDLSVTGADVIWSDRLDIQRPDALLFDLDGVLADVSSSYRACVTLTASVYGVTITETDISSAKRAGNANNDWILTQKLLAIRGVDVDLQDVINVYQQYYVGSRDKPGLRDSERLLIDPSLLERLGSTFRLAIVTGRPRDEATHFLSRFRIDEYFEIVIAMEDAPSKPDPTGVRQATGFLESTRPWMMGDTPDDMRAATGAGATPVGVVDPKDIQMASALKKSGATLLISSINELSRILL